MTRDELRGLGELLYGYGWQRRMAEEFRKDERTVRRWVAGDRDVPEDIAAALRQMAAIASGKERIPALGATVVSVPSIDELPALVARIVRLWAELYCADPALAIELAGKLPKAEIRRTRK